MNALALLLALTPIAASAQEPAKQTAEAVRQVRDQAAPAAKVEPAQRFHQTRKAYAEAKQRLSTLRTQYRETPTAELASQLEKGRAVVAEKRKALGTLVSTLETLPAPREAGFETREAQGKDAEAPKAEDKGKDGEKRARDKGGKAKAKGKKKGLAKGKKQKQAKDKEDKGEKADKDATAPVKQSGAEVASKAVEAPTDRVARRERLLSELRLESELEALETRLDGELAVAWKEAHDAGQPDTYKEKRHALLKTFTEKRNALQRAFREASGQRVKR